LRLHCVCNLPSNPDKLLFRCENKACEKWLHDDCLVENLADTLVQPRVNGSTNAKPQKARKSDVKSQKPFDIERVLNNTAEIKDPLVFRITPRDKPSQYFTVTIKEVTKKKQGEDVVTYKFFSTDMAGHSTKKPWELPIKCLACQTVID